jgi:hypothetical protein
VTPDSRTEHRTHGDSQRRNTVTVREGTRVRAHQTEQNTEHGDTLPVLLEYLQMPTEDDLPDLWHRWANCTKKQEVQVLRDVLDGYARSADAFSPLVPIVTPRLVQDLLSFTFLGQSADDIRTGLHPLLLLMEMRNFVRQMPKSHGYMGLSMRAMQHAPWQTWKH